MNPSPGNQAWLDQVKEDVLEPGRPIIDPHHHLWPEGHLGLRQYLLAELWRDTGSGHKIERTVFLECGTGYRASGPEHLKPVGETAFVADVAAEMSKAGGSNAVIAGIVGYADLTGGDQLDEALDAHAAAGRGLFRGIRHAGARHPRPEEGFLPGRAPAGLFLDSAFQAGVRRLGQRGYTYESWLYHFQIAEFAALARSAPDTVIILDHLGTPLGAKSFRDRRDETLANWRTDIALLAQCPNVHVKLGGMAMPDNGFGWDVAARPATSDELSTAQREYYLHAIACFGPQRCMFESNFPVDRLSISYAVLWNAFKKIAAGFSESDKSALFHDTAARVYRL
jgi:predicted TIM-barrel fold metal-dependent hydrolase